jgi:hypothetical protein
MISPRFCQAAVPWKTTATQIRASGENRVSTKLGVFQSPSYPICAVMPPSLLRRVNASSIRP